MWHNRDRIYPDNLEMIGKEASLVSNIPGNLEFTTAFGLNLACDAINVHDESDEGLELERLHRWSTLVELRNELETRPETLADGLQRFLRAIRSDRPFRCAVYRFLNHRRWVLNSGCSSPEGPGCGCPDCDFSAEHLFTGSWEEAAEEAKRINRERYVSDFSWWVDADLKDKA